MATATRDRADTGIRAIHNGKEFDAAVVELDQLIDANPKEGTWQYDRMELLTIVIAAYEDEHLPSFEAATPQEIVRFMAEQRQIKPHDLAQLLGGRSRLSEFYKGTRELSKSQIVKLRDALGIPADLLFSI